MIDYSSALAKTHTSLLSQYKDVRIDPRAQGLGNEFLEIEYRWWAASLLLIR